jgi:hypothetical protein
LEFHDWYSSNEANTSTALEPIIQVRRASTSTELQRLLRVLQ